MILDQEHALVDRLQANLETLKRRRYQDFAIRWQTSIYWIEEAFEIFDLENWPHYREWTRNEFFDWYNEQVENYFTVTQTPTNHSDDSRLAKAIDDLLKEKKM